MPLSRYVNSAAHHLFAYLEGKDDEDHAAQAAWNVFAIMFTEEMIARSILPMGLMDLPNHTELPGGTVVAQGSAEGWKRAAEAGEKISETTQKVIDRNTMKLAMIQAEKLGYQRGKAHARTRVVPGDGPLNIYVSGPYSAPNREGVLANISKANSIGRMLVNKGHRPFVPHAATDPLGDLRDWQWFIDGDLEHIKYLDDALFYIAPSPGADMEREYAQGLGLPVYYHYDEVPLVNEEEQCESVSEESTTS